MGRASFIVEYLEIDMMAALLEACHDMFVGGKAVFILPGLEGAREDGVGVAVEGDENVLVSAAGPNREPPCVVSIELADMDVQLFGWGCRHGL